MLTIFGIPDIERRKKRNLPICQPQGSLSESRWFKFTFSCGLPTRRLIPGQFKWCSAVAANVAFVVSVIVDIILYPAVVLHRAPVPAFR